MRILWMIALPILVFPQVHSLRDLIEHAHVHNPLIESSELKSKAKAKEVEAKQSAYWPTLDIGANYSRVNPNSLISPGETASGYISVGMELYDGGRKNALKKAKTFEYQASLFEQKAFSKSITLDIVNRYYTIQKLKAMLYALDGQSKELQAQMLRVKKFTAAGLSTQEDIDKLQAVYEDNRYTIENTKLLLETQEENLQLISGLSVQNIKKNHFEEPKNIKFEVYENSKMLQANANALEENANAIDAGYKPQVVFQDTYTKSHYDDLVNSGGFSTEGLLLDHQNKVTLSVNMRLFDHGKMKKEREAAVYQKMALDAEYSHRIREQKMNFNLSSSSLKTIRVKLESANSALKAAKSTYKSIVKKFEVGLVDNIAYLDALNEQTLAQARHKETLYEYEIAKSIYYYYAGKDPKEFVR
ncbi:MAG: outer membrane protein [Campylobacterota bacterium]|nr:outer membrane protein [Campylobacterota bacterium]